MWPSFAAATAARTAGWTGAVLSDAKLATSVRLEDGKGGGADGDLEFGRSRAPELPVAVDLERRGPAEADPTRPGVVDFAEAGVFPRHHERDEGHELGDRHRTDGTDVQEAVIGERPRHDLEPAPLDRPDPD